jgi:hypothetical protein
VATEPETDKEIRMTVPSVIRNTFAASALALGLVAAQAQTAYPNGEPTYQQQPMDNGQYQQQPQDQGQYQQEQPAGPPAVTATYAPPAIPDYEQPPCPGDGYLWTPGYWAWGTGGYYWVPGAWVVAPYVGALWTPGYWGWYNGFYGWYPGYWGRHIGYYGGINYGFGYFGIGFYGGYWNGGHVFYNRAYGHFGEGFHGAFYNRTYSGFNGRPGGTSFAGRSFAGNAVSRGSNVASARGGYNGGQTFGNRGAVPAQSVNRGGYAGGAQSYRQAPSSQSYSRGAASSQSFNRGAVSSAPRAQSYSAPRGGGSSFGGGGHASYSGGGGGGGGFHGGGGGGGHAGGHR